LPEGFREWRFHLFLGTGQCKQSEMPWYLLTTFFPQLKIFVFSFPPSFPLKKPFKGFIFNFQTHHGFLFFFCVCKSSTETGWHLHVGGAGEPGPAEPLAGRAMGSRRVPPAQPLLTGKEPPPQPRFCLERRGRGKPRHRASTPKPATLWGARSRGGLRFCPCLAAPSSGCTATVCPASPATQPLTTLE